MVDEMVDEMVDCEMVDCEMVEMVMRWDGGWWDVIAYGNEMVDGWDDISRKFLWDGNEMMDCMMVDEMVRWL